MPRPPRAPDLTHSCPDGIWTRFYPETAAGEEAWRSMAAADPQGVVAFLPAQVPGVVAQLKAAGLKVAKAKPVSAADLEAILDEIDVL